MDRALDVITSIRAEKKVAQSIREQPSRRPGRAVRGDSRRPRRSSSQRVPRSIRSGNSPAILVKMDLSDQPGICQGYPKVTGFLGGKGVRCRSARRKPRDHASVQKASSAEASITSRSRAGAGRDGPSPRSTFRRRSGRREAAQVRCRSSPPPANWNIPSREGVTHRDPPPRHRAGGDSARLMGRTAHQLRTTMAKKIVGYIKLQVPAARPIRRRDRSGAGQAA